MKYLKKILYIGVLILGVAGVLIALAAGVGLFYGLYYLIKEMIVETRTQELFGLFIFGGCLILLMYFVMNSPNLIAWAWKQLRKKK